MNITKLKTWREDLIDSLINESRDSLKEELPVYISRIKEILTSLDVNEAERIVRDLIDDDLSDVIELRIKIIGMGESDRIDKVHTLSEMAKLKQNNQIAIERKTNTALRNWRYIRIHLRDALTPATVQDGTKLTIDQVALLYYYLGEKITRGNGDNIAQKYGHSSGEKLFQRFSYFTKRVNRIGDPQGVTSKKLENKIKLIKSVIKLLPETKHSQPSNELNTLESHLSEYYPDNL